LKLNLIALLSVITVCLLAVPVMADYNSYGWPVVTRATGTINGGVFIDSESNFQTLTTLDTNVPAGTVKYAYLYTGVWGGTNTYTGWMNVTFNGDHTSNGLGPIHLEGIDDTNPNVWCTGSGKYWMWYNVTDLTSAGSANTATTSKINSTSGTFDGKVYGIVLVVVLENQSEPMIQYWINDGSDGLNYNTPHNDGTTYFNGAVSTSNVVGSALTMLHLTAELTSCSDCLEFNGHPLSTGMISEYFELNTWDETNSNVKPANVTALGNNVWYSRGDDGYVNVCNAILVLGLEDEGDVLEFGDATDPTYPSLLASDGARHNPTNNECLGLQSNSEWKDYEFDAKVPDLDNPFDDGLVNGNIVANSPAQTVTFEVSELTGTPDLIANILIDLNIDGDWNDAGEHVVVNQPISIAGGEGTVVSMPFSTAGATPGLTWMRITLTRSQINSGWDGTMTSYAQMIPFTCGETEDWEVNIEEEGQPEPDLIVTAINAYHNSTSCTPWFNLSNEIDVTVMNNGGGAAGPSSVSLYIEGMFFDKLPVSGLGAGMSETVTFTGWKPIGDDCLQPPCNYACLDKNYNLSAIADCDSNVAESDETNNVTSAVETACYNGYMADEPLENMFHGMLNGGLLFTTGDGTYGDVPDSSYKDTNYQITLPSGASVELARLNVYYTWHTDTTSCPQFEVTIENASGTYVVPLDASYNDIKCYCAGAYYVYPWGNYVYDITSYIQGSGNYTVGVKRTGVTPVRIVAPGIEVLYRDDTKPLIEYWLNEGADLLTGGRRGVEGYLAWWECINNATFQTSTQTREVVNATLGVVSPFCDDAPNDILFFNGIELGRGVYHGFGGTYLDTIDGLTMEVGSTNAQVGVNVSNVTALYQKGNSNVAGQADDGDCMMPANAFLVVEYATIPATPFLIDGWVNCTTGEAVNGPSVVISNLDTGEVFTAQTDAGSNSYQVLTSSYNVSAGDELHFNVESGSSEVDHTVTVSEMESGGFTQNVTVDCSGPVGLCGDVTGDDKVNMGDVTKLLWNQTYWGQYPVDAWSADVTGDDKVNMGDVTKLLWNQTYWGQYPLTCPC